VQPLPRAAPRPALWHEASFALEDRDSTDLSGPAAAVRFLLEPAERLHEEEKTQVARFRLWALAGHRDQKRQPNA
jgi:hypothetical protein